MPAKRKTQETEVEMETDAKDRQEDKAPKPLPSRAKLETSKKERKFAVKQLEKTNREYIYIYQADNDYWNMGGISALEYHYVLMPRIGKKTNLLNDMDYYSVFRTGIVAVKDLESLRKNMAMAGAEEIERPELGTRILVFRLPTPLSDGDVDALINMPEEQRKRLNKTLRIKHPIPELDEFVRLALVDTYNALKKKEKMGREIVGDRIVRELFEMRMEYLRGAQGSYAEQLSSMRSIYSRCLTVLNAIKTASDMHLMTLPAATDANRKVILVLRKAETEGKRLKDLVGEEARDAKRGSEVL